jgi:hypothetical protein
MTQLTLTFCTKSGHWLHKGSRVHPDYIAQLMAKLALTATRQAAGKYAHPTQPSKAEIRRAAQALTQGHPITQLEPDPALRRGKSSRSAARLAAINLTLDDLDL